MKAFGQGMSSLVDPEGGWTTMIGADWAQGRTICGAKFGTLCREGMCRGVNERGSLRSFQLDSEVIAAGEGYVSQNSEIVNPDGKIVALSHLMVAVHA
ncbi:MAG: hypothetical protein ABIT36_00740 [Steroidobacteraceae bacterium]